jgi:hypothetical protein
MVEGRAWRGLGIGMAVQASGLLVLLAVLPAIAQDPSIKVITATIASSGAHKECLSLSRTQSLRYWFRSDAPIDFNIQYQDAGGVVYPVRREKLSMGTGGYPAKTAEVHCMVLTNKARKPVTVRLEFVRVER